MGARSIPNARRVLLQFSVGLPTMFLLLSCGGGGGGGGQQTSPPPPSTVTLTASPARVLPGFPVTLKWASTNATSCTASQGWSGSLGMSGEQTTTVGAADTTFAIRCEGVGAASQTSASVDVVPAGEGTMVSLAASTPAAAKQTIRTVASWNDTSTLDAAVSTQTLEVPGGRLVLALNAAEEIVMAAFTDRSTTVLSSATTATALTRFLIARDPQVSILQIDAAIESAASYPLLVDAIDAALASGATPQSSAAVISHIGAVLAEALPILRPQGATQAKSGRAASHGKVTAQHTLTTLPLQLWGVDPRGVRIQELYSTDPNAYGARVVNRSALTWAMSTSTTSSANRADPIGNLTKEAYVGGSGLLKAVLLGETQDLQGAAPVYHLNVRQNEESRQENVAKAIVDTINVILENLIAAKIPDACLKPVIQELSTLILGTVSLLNSRSEVTKEDVVSYVTELLLKRRSVYMGYINACASQEVEDIVWGSLLRYVNIAGRVIDAGDALTTIVQLALAWNTHVEVAICQFGKQLKLCTPWVRVHAGPPPDWTGDPGYGLWGVASYGREGVQCVRSAITIHQRIYRSDGTLQSETNRTGGDTTCTEEELGGWRRKSDGNSWGLLLSGGVTHGRMVLDGTVTVSLPNSQEPTAKNVEYTYDCQVTDLWSCSVVGPPLPPMDPAPPEPPVP